MASKLTNFPLAPDDDRRHAEADVLRSLVDGLISEDLFGFRSRARIGSVAGALYLPLADDERHVQVGIGREAVVFRARPAGTMQPYRLSRPPVLLLGTEGAGGPIPLNPRELLEVVIDGLAEREPVNFAEVCEALDLAVTHGSVLIGAEWTWGRVVSADRPALLDWEALTALGDRPFHPTGRARQGWDRARYRRYSTAADRPFALDWVAVRRDHLEIGSVDRLAEALMVARVGQPGGSTGRGGEAVSERDPAPADALLSVDERSVLATAMGAAGVDGPDYVVLPVHPWQHAHGLADAFAAQWRDGVCVPVAEGLGAFRATAATRTLVPDGARAQVHVKLPVGISTLGAVRLLPPRRLANAARAQQMLQVAASWHHALEDRLHVCDEQAWWAFAPPESGEGEGEGGNPGHLGCLLRVWPDGIGRGPAQSLVPLGALGVVVPEDGSAPGLARFISERGEDPDSPAAALAVFDDVAGVVSEVALACFGFGFMPGLHGQNAVLACESGRVTGVVLRDHDTVRIHGPWLAAAGLPGPGYDGEPGASGSLHATGPEELLGWFQTLTVEVAFQAIGRALVSAYGVEEDTVWRRLGDVVRAARSGVDLPPEAASIAERQLFHAASWPTKLVLGPLLAGADPGGGTMPSAVGRAGNPFLAGDDRAAELADHAAAERLVNCFLRESGTDPVLVGSTLTIPFTRARRAVVASLAYLSPTGHHHFRPGFTLRTGEVAGCAELARLVASELAPLVTSAAPDGFESLVADSAAKTCTFLERIPVTGTVDPWHAPNPFLAAEQSLRAGHPLHPAPKSSPEFEAKDLECFAPELGASFPLHWMAVDPRLLGEDRLGTVRSLDPPPVLCDAAAAGLGDERASWPLLPCHPWQFEELVRLPVVAAMTASGALVPLGPLGFDVHPTASVRNVWDPASGRQLKLPLSARIADRMLENRDGPVRRSLDASRALVALGDLDKALDAPDGGFGVLLELGFRQVLAPDGWPAAEAGALRAASAVIYREGPATAGAAAPMMLAALLEADPLNGVPPVVRAVRQTGRGEAAGRAWLARYLEVSLLPLTRLAVRHGVGLPADAQGSLVALDGGWPARFVVSELEGACLNRDHPCAVDRFGGSVAVDSPAWATESEVWQRFGFHLLVDHLGQLIATLAEHVGPSEGELWSLASALLAEEVVRHGPDPAVAPLRAMLDAAVLPARANLLGILEGRGAHPAWIGVPNPLRAKRRS